MLSHGVLDVIAGVWGYDMFSMSVALGDKVVPTLLVSGVDILQTFRKAVFRALSLVNDKILQKSMSDNIVKSDFFSHSVSVLVSKDRQDESEE